VIAADVGTAAQLACLLEVSAPKPGNVSPGSHFGDTRFEDFLAGKPAWTALFTPTPTTSLAAAMWTRDLSLAHLSVRTARAGTVWASCY